jgi:putative transposase
VLTEVGPVPLAVPRDRVSTFESRLVPKGARRVGGGLDEMIISLYAGGMTVRDIGHHLHRNPRRGAVPRHHLEDHPRGGRGGQGLAAPAAGPGYSIIWIDALVVKVRDGAHVVNKSGENHPSAVNGRIDRTS